MADGKLAKFVNEVNWLKIGLSVVITIAIVLLYNKIFGKNGIIGGIWSGISSAAQTGFEAAKHGVEYIEESAGQAYKISQAAAQSTWDYWFGDN